VTSGEAGGGTGFTNGAGIGTYRRRCRIDAVTMLRAPRSCCLGEETHLPRRRLVAALLCTDSNRQPYPQSLRNGKCSYGTILDRLRDFLKGEAKYRGRLFCFRLTSRPCVVTGLCRVFFTLRLTLRIPFSSESRFVLAYLGIRSLPHGQPPP
jgi:hypothetical protein